MNTPHQAASISSEPVRRLKECCARLYESDFAKILLGDSFHPGGLALTERLGTLLGLGPKSRVLDVASGPGSSAFLLAERFGCQVIGVDYSEQNVRRANQMAATKGLSPGVHFERGDAEHLDFPDASFEAVVCECAFCTFPDKLSAAREFSRVLRKDGRVGISDLTRARSLPKELDSLLAWISCIADAQPIDSYIAYLSSVGLVMQMTESHDAALLQMARDVQGKLFAAEVAAALKKIELPGVDFGSGKQMVKTAIAGIQQGQLGYSVIVAEKRAAY